VAAVLTHEAHHLKNVCALGTKEAAANIKAAFGVVQPMAQGLSSNKGLHYA